MPFPIDYFLLIFLSTCGVLQLVSLWNGLIFLSFANRLIVNLPLSVVMIIGPFIWFFVSENRNVPDTSTGLDGNQQAMLFIAGSLAGLIFTLLITSLRGTNPCNKCEHSPRGLDTLRKTTYLRALVLTLRLRHQNENL